MLQREQKKEIYRALLQFVSKNYKNFGNIKVRWRKITGLLHFPR